MRATCTATANETGSDRDDDASNFIGNGGQFGRSAKGFSGERGGVNEVDSWIDELELNRRNDPFE